MAASVWGGGLAWLVTRERTNVEAFAVDAARVSSAALTAVILIVLSGTAQAMLFMYAPADLIHTGYGIIVLLKIAGLLVLVGYGAHHRRQVPRLRGTLAADALTSTVRHEIVVLVIVAMLGAWLAYVPPKNVDTSADTGGLFPHWIQR